MKASEITVSDIARYLRIDDDADETVTLKPILDAAKSYVKESTALTDDQLDELPDITLAIMVLCQDMYDNRSMYVDKGNANRVVSAILHMHRRNFV